MIVRCHPDDPWPVYGIFTAHYKPGEKADILINFIGDESTFASGFSLRWCLDFRKIAKEKWGCSECNFTMAYAPYAMDGHWPSEDDELFRDLENLN